MRIILIKQVPKLGNPGDVIDVNPGYARNFILAKGLGREATEGALREVQQEKQKKAKQKEQLVKKRHKLHDILSGQSILIRATANPEGILFGGIDRQAIAATILKRKKVEIDAKQLDLPHHIKTLGQHGVVLNLGGGERVKFNVNVQN
ncbi:MAG: 50S ribosomal protein L9 [Patescibacteria group bacterium]